MKTPEEIEKIAEDYAHNELSIYPDKSKNLSEDEIHRIKTVVFSHSYIGFKNGYTQSQQDNINDKYTFKELTDEILVENVCLSFRHDFGLMNNEEREKLRFECKEWLRALFNNQHLLKK